MIPGQLVMIEIVQRRFVAEADVDDTDAGIGELLRGRLAPDDRHGMKREQNAARQKLIVMGTARMSENRLNGSRHE